MNFIQHGYEQCFNIMWVYDVFAFSAKPGSLRAIHDMILVWTSSHLQNNEKKSNHTSEMQNKTMFKPHQGVHVSTFGMTSYRIE